MNGEHELRLALTSFIALVLINGLFFGAGVFDGAVQSDPPEFSPGNQSLVVADPPDPPSSGTQTRTYEVDDPGSVIVDPQFRQAGLQFPYNFSVGEDGQSSMVGAFRTREGLGVQGTPDSIDDVLRGVDEPTANATNLTVAPSSANNPDVLLYENRSWVEDGDHVQLWLWEDGTQTQLERGNRSDSPPIAYQNAQERARITVQNVTIDSVTIQFTVENQSSGWLDSLVDPIITIMAQIGFVVATIVGGIGELGLLVIEGGRWVLSFIGYLVTGWGTIISQTSGVAQTLTLLVGVVQIPLFYFTFSLVVRVARVIGGVSPL